MSRLAKLIVSCICVLALSACAGMQLAGPKLEQAQGVTPTGSDFQKGLYTGYLDLAASEYGEGHYSATHDFADRAISAGTGQVVEPEEISRRTLPEDKVGELTAVRQRLVDALAGGAAERKPAEAAHAQVMFDCWMEEQEENDQPNDIARCRSGFMDVIAKLEEAPPKVAELAPEPEPAPPPVPGPVVVFFDFDKADLTAEAQAKLTKAVRDAKEAKVTKIFASGHTDRAGQSTYNDTLSKLRVDAAAKFLIAIGIDKAKVLTTNYGEEQPQVSTPDGRAEPRNRRVEVNFAR